MENVIYNELIARGCNVDVGVVEVRRNDGRGGKTLCQLEIDFVVNIDVRKVYVQSAFKMPTLEKENQEQRSLLSINDNFQKIIIVGDNIMRKVNEYGIVTIGLIDFLLDPNSISSLLGKK